jgi:hypothetical protein
MPEGEFSIVKAGPKYELLDFSSLCHCYDGMASLMPDRIDGMVDRKQEKPEKVSLHLVVLESLTNIIVLSNITVLDFWQFVNANW